MASVVIESLDKWFGGFHAIHGLDLAIADGSFVALVGPSGCGKSTTLRMIAGLEMPSRGSIRIGTENVTARPPSERGVSMVFQSYALYPHMTVRENLGFGLKVAGVAKAERACRVADAARLLEIGHLLNRRPAQLSGGQRQRTAIGRALVRDPKVFLFDEPLSNLDAQLRNAMRVEIKKLHQRLEATIVFVTHDQTEAMTMADTIVVMRDGSIEQVGSPLDVYERPSNAFVAGFIGAPSMRFFEGRVETEASAPRVRLADALVLELPGDRFERLTNGQPVRVGVRPEDIIPEGHGIAPQHAARFEAEVALIEPLGNETLIVIPFAGGEAMSRMYRPRPVRVGERLRFAMDLARIHLFDPQAGHSLLAARRAA